MMTNKAVKKLMTFPPQLYYSIEKKAKRVGLPFQEYVRHVLVNDIEEYVEILDDETSKEVEQAMKEYEEGKFVEFDPHNPKEMKKALS